MKLEFFPIEAATARPFKISQGVETGVRVLICEVTHDGVTGRGEAAPSQRVTGETDASIRAYLEWARGEVANLDPSGIVKFLDLVHAGGRGNSGARAALDLALHDLAGKLAGKPVHALYDLPAARLETTMTVSLDEPAVMAAEALDYWSRGFRCIKIKLGDATRDLERLAAIRRTVPEARLRVDANTAWSWEESYRLVREMVPFNVEFVEQPLPPDDLDGMVT